MSTITKLPHGCEEMRVDIHAVIKRFPEMTVAETVGVVEIVKQDLFEMLRDDGDEGGVRTEVRDNDFSQ